MPNAVVQVLLRERVRVTAVAAAVARDIPGADDVFQQVVLDALESNEKFRDADHLIAWALRAARHRAIDAARKRHAVLFDEATLDLLESAWDGPAGETAARVEALGRCMDKLPAPSRELLRLRYEDGLACGRVADRLGRSVDAVYQTLSRVHRQLRACIERELR
jgi:RNA polymerase sigma-70 factor (ECF subfamily)